MRPAFAATARTTIKRKPERESYDEATIEAILDEGFVAHVGVTVDDEPYVLPMVYARDGRDVLLHGSVASRLLRRLDDGVAVCVTVTLVDGLVLATAQRNHSLNYRSVVLLGTARRLRGGDAARALAAVVDHVAPGRAAEARPPTDAELRDTLVLAVPVDEASAKLRSGPPLPGPPDDEGWDCWAGVVPLGVATGAPVAALGSEQRPVPGSVTPWRRPSR